MDKRLECSKYIIILLFLNRFINPDLTNKLDNKFALFVNSRPGVHLISRKNLPVYSALTACEEEHSVDQMLTFFIPKEYLKVKIPPSRSELGLEIDL